MIFNRVVPSDPDLLDTATAARAPEAIDAKGDFDRELDTWLDDLEGRLPPAGRQTPQVAESVSGKTAIPSSAIHRHWPCQSPLRAKRWAWCVVKPNWCPKDASSCAPRRWSRS